eukprot:2762929-Alexandrium_andersonii.AAC.1
MRLVWSSTFTIAAAPSSTTDGPSDAAVQSLGRLQLYVRREGAQRRAPGASGRVVAGILEAA